MLDRLKLLVLFDELDKELLDCPLTELVIAGGASINCEAADFKVGKFRRRSRYSDTKGRSE